MVAAASKKGGAGSASGARTMVASWVKALEQRLDDDRRGGVRLIVTAVVTGVLSAALYWPMGLPGRLLTGVLTRASDGSCVGTTTGIENGFCGFGVSLVAVSGAIVVLVVLFVFRRQLRKRSAQAIQRAPPAFHFLERPVVTTLVFAMAWSSVYFNFYSRVGIIIEGLFPALIGILIFALQEWGHVVQARMQALLDRRDKLPKVVLIVLVIVVPVLLGSLMTGWMPFGVRDQLAALFAVCIGWLIWTPNPGRAPASRRGAVAATALIFLIGAILLLLAVPVAAKAPCADARLYDSYPACEAAHHGAAFGGLSGVIGMAGAAVVVGPSRSEEDGPREKAPKGDPCADVQGRYDEARAMWMIRNDTVQSMRKLANRLEAEYLARNESLFAGQVANLAMQAVSIFRTRLPGGMPAPQSLMQRLGGTGQDLFVETIMEHGLKASMDAPGPSGQDAVAVYDKMVAGTINSELKGQIQAALRKKAEDTLKETGTKIPTNSPVFRGMVDNLTTETMEAFESVTAGIAGVVGLHGMISKYGDLKGFLDKIHDLRLRIIDLDGDNDMLKDTLLGLKYDVVNCRERVTMGLGV